MRTSPRSQKAAGVIHTLLPSLLQQYTTPNQVGFISVSAVELSGDLGVADVFVTQIGSAKDWLKNLQKIAPKLEHEISKALKLRRKLLIRFKMDKSPQHIKNIQNLTNNDQ